MPGETAVQELPPTETGPVPVEHAVSQRRLFGVPPSSVLLVLGAAGVALAVALFLTGYWPWGLIVLGLSIFTLLGFLSVARQLPGDASPAGQAPLDAVRSARARAGAVVESIATQGTARLELARLRREAGRLVAERHTRLRELGAAVYEEHEAAAKELTGKIKDLDAELESKEAQMRKVTMDAIERVGRAQMRVRPTEILGETPGEPLEPAPVPGPFPPPDEGQPPQPARVPEPVPAPDAASRPEQSTVPEPGHSSASK
jgi:hypothetical protein